MRAAITMIVLALMCSATMAFAAPGASTSATASAASSASAESTRAPREYDLDFTLPTQGKSGCLVCHGDANLARVSLVDTTSIYVDIAVLQESAHAEGTPCTGCHLDFAYTAPHKQVDGGEEWQSAAKSACKNCHKEVFSEYANGAHSPAGQPGTEPSVTVAARVKEGKPLQVPFCGDCHGGHSIPASDNVQAQAQLFLSGNRMCGQVGCHEAEAGSYEDYYHGAAYRRGSLDAPSCWDCHGFHDIIPVDDRTSPVHPSRLSDTCGQEGCHEDADDEAFLEYAELIHGQREIKNDNPVIAAVSKFKSSVRSAFEAVRSWF